MAITNLHQSIRDTIDSWARREIRLQAEIIEGKLRLVIKPRPAWCPERLHKWLLRELLVMEEFHQ